MTKTVLNQEINAALNYFCYPLYSTSNDKYAHTSKQIHQKYSSAVSKHVESERGPLKLTSLYIQEQVRSLWLKL